MTTVQTVLTSPFDASQSGFGGPSPHAGDLRAMETRLSAQMDALGDKMAELMGDAVHRVTLPRGDAGSTFVVKSVSKEATPRPAGHAEPAAGPPSRTTSTRNRGTRASVLVCSGKAPGP